MHETIHYHGRPAWLYYLGLLVMSGAALLISFSADRSAAGIVVSAIFFLLAAFGRYRKEYTLTNQRVIARVGLIANNTSEMELRHIRGMNVHQNIFERLLGVGTLEIISAADGGAEVVFQGISNPEHIKDMIRSGRGTP